MSKLHDKHSNTGSFDMTPIIDVVFLLIIFFMLVCQFIVAENFEVAVPDDISAARQEVDSDQQMTTVTVMFDEDKQINYAVGSELVTNLQGPDLSSAIADQINRQLQNLPLKRRIVTLRIDKDIPYGDGQYALAGISQSSATDIKLAATKEKLK